MDGDITFDAGPERGVFVKKVFPRQPLLWCNSRCCGVNWGLDMEYLLVGICVVAHTTHLEWLV